MTQVYVRCASHRARRHLTAYMVNPQGYYHWSYPNNYGTYLIEESDLAEARKIPGITKRREQTGWLKCWETEGAG